MVAIAPAGQAISTAEGSAAAVSTATMRTGSHRRSRDPRYRRTCRPRSGRRSRRGRATCRSHRDRCGGTHVLSRHRSPRRSSSSGSTGSTQLSVGWPPSSTGLAGTGHQRSGGSSGSASSGSVQSSQRFAAGAERRQPLEPLRPTLLNDAVGTDRGRADAPLPTGGLGELDPRPVAEVDEHRTDAVLIVGRTSPLASITAAADRPPIHPTPVSATSPSTTSVAGPPGGMRWTPSRPSRAASTQTVPSGPRTARLGAAAIGASSNSAPAARTAATPPSWGTIRLRLSGTVAAHRAEGLEWRAKSMPGRRPCRGGESAGHRHGGEEERWASDGSCSSERSRCGTIHPIGGKVRSAQVCR